MAGGLKPHGSDRPDPRKVSHTAYVKQKKRFLAVHKYCARYSWAHSTQIHHVRGKLGPLLTDERFWLPVSFAGHRWIHDHPDEARAKGLLAAIGEWNMPTEAGAALPAHQGRQGFFVGRNAAGECE
jgi:hypothetical protein